MESGSIKKKMEQSVIPWNNTVHALTARLALLALLALLAPLALLVLLVLLVLPVLLYYTGI